MLPVRKLPRSSGRMRVAVPVRYKSSSGDVLMLQTENISEGGMLLLSPQLVPVSEQFAVTIEHPAFGTPMEALVQVRFVGPSQEGFALGVQILSMKEDDLAKWTQWCRKGAKGAHGHEAELASSAHARVNGDLLMVGPALSSGTLGHLIENGYHVNVACDANDALALLHKRRDVDIVICELRRQDYDGRTLCGLLNHDRALQSVQVILLTDQATAQSLHESLDAGATYVAVRPFSDDFFLSLISLCQRG